MKNVMWELFSKTGNIETYLLLKEIESEKPQENVVDYSEEIDSTMEFSNDM